jgi:hypothetical protein
MRLHHNICSRPPDDSMRHYGTVGFGQIARRASRTLAQDWSSETSSQNGRGSSLLSNRQRSSINEPAADLLLPLLFACCFQLSTVVLDVSIISRNLLATTCLSIGLVIKLMTNTFQKLPRPSLFAAANTKDRPKDPTLPHQVSPLHYAVRPPSSACLTLLHLHDGIT